MAKKDTKAASSDVTLISFTGGSRLDININGVSVSIKEGETKALTKAQIEFGKSCGAVFE